MRWCVYWNEYVKADYIYVLWDRKDQMIPIEKLKY